MPPARSGLLRYFRRPASRTTKLRWLAPASILAMGVLGWTGFGAIVEERLNRPLTSESDSHVVPWTTGKPAARQLAMMAYDARDRYVVLFGGVDPYGNVLGDTWTYHAGAWTKLAVSPHPPARYGGSMTYDAADGYLLLFGGCGSYTCPLGDTWAFAGGIWTHLHPHPHPSPRMQEMMAYDARDGYVVFFGGLNSTSYTTLSDTWTFYHGKWTQLFLTTSPSDRSYGMMAFDGRDFCVVLFGGTNQTGFIFGDTWTYSGGAWTTFVPASRPSARYGAMMSEDTNDSYVVMFGGITNRGDSSSTWTYAAGQWTQRSPTSHPSARDSGMMDDDGGDGYLVLFGGSTVYGSTAYRDTWSYTAGVFTKQ